MTLQELEQLPKRRERIENLKDQLEEIRARTLISSRPRLDNVQGGFRSDKTGDTATKCADISKMLNDEINEYAKAYKEILTYLDKCRDKGLIDYDFYLLAFGRFIRCNTWNDIGQWLGKNRSSCHKRFKRDLHNIITD
ncbi:hypothetical protein [Alkalibacter saccharofermentans]|uniref:Phage transcriptional activator, RinA family n=1 Tax=Alkalibacter saccharofermentans DSM 14828 TaxID=1120975 RepID=A0A1M4ZIC9_9FIRM|nr:hypothetical protein [Alkalibacter saccharofermentans]SHF17542.1 hypothetical protein SAMN02746064_02053 [Alkalibacter saccharofermentans DSM 14828]